MQFYTTDKTGSVFVGKTPVYVNGFCHLFVYILASSRRFVLSKVLIFVMEYTFDNLATTPEVHTLNLR